MEWTARTAAVARDETHVKHLATEVFHARQFVVLVVARPWGMYPDHWFSIAQSCEKLRRRCGEFSETHCKEGEQEAKRTLDTFHEARLETRNPARTRPATTTRADQPENPEENDNSSAMLCLLASSSAS